MTSPQRFVKFYKNKYRCTSVHTQTHTRVISLWIPVIAFLPRCAMEWRAVALRFQCTATRGNRSWCIEYEWSLSIVTHKFLKSESQWAAPAVAILSWRHNSEQTASSCHIMRPRPQLCLHLRNHLNETGELYKYSLHQHSHHGCD